MLSFLWLKEGTSLLRSALIGPDQCLAEHACFDLLDRFKLPHSADHTQPHLDLFNGRSLFLEESRRTRNNLRFLT